MTTDPANTSEREGNEASNSRAEKEARIVELIGTEPILRGLSTYLVCPYCELGVTQCTCTVDGRN